MILKNKLSFIVAVDAEFGFSKNYKIPWKYVQDFKFFKDTTADSICLMGRNTYEEIAEMRKYPDKVTSLLPSRLCLVLSSSCIPETDWVKRIKSIDDAKITYERDSEHNNFFYIGGLRVYDQALVDTDCEIGYITKLKKTFDCDLFFNESLLRDNFSFSRTMYEDDDMVIEKWTRI